MKYNRVGLGTFPLANVFSKITKSESKELVHTFIQSGGYYIDTAPMYGFGEVETLLGEVLAEFSRDDYFLITKCMYIDVEGKTFATIEKSGKYEDVVRECERSLKRLKTDRIDLYFVHSPDPNTPFSETMEALRDLKKQGKIKQIGVSNVDLEELREFNVQGDVEFIQNRFSFINRSIDHDFSEYLSEHKIGLIPYQVIDRGQLSKRVIEGTSTFVENDLRIGRCDWEPARTKVIADWMVAEIEPIARELSISTEQLMIAWALAQPYLSFVIVGATKQKHLVSNLRADKVELSTDSTARLKLAYEKLEKKIKSEFAMTIREFRGLNEKYY